jgi:hypothetical protein
VYNKANQADLRLAFGRFMCREWNRRHLEPGMSVLKGEKSEERVKERRWREKRQKERMGKQETEREENIFITFP